MMASNLPVSPFFRRRRWCPDALFTYQTRRVTRQARAVSQKDSENATARPVRPLTRSKPPSNAAGVAPAHSRVTAPTLASRAKANGHDENKADLVPQGKRKREALGEVAKNVTKSKNVVVPSNETKPEKFDGVVIKATTTGRQPLRAVTRSTTRRTTKGTTIVPSRVQLLEDVKEDIRQEHKQAPPERPRPERKVPIQDHHVFKKRRTSSEAPEDIKAFDDRDQHEVAQALQAGLESEPEADPNGCDWDDLDADDEEDPLMVSEYVHEIFTYMKQIEVSTSRTCL